MNERGFVTMNMRELERIKIIAAVAERRLKVVQAAERLALCERQVSRLVRRYEASGPAGLVSSRRGQPSNRELSIDVRAQAMALVRERYADFGPTLACEKLRECHGVALTVQYDRVIYMLADTAENRDLIHKYLDVFEYPDGRIEIRVNGAALPYVEYDRLSQIDQGAELDNKRLGHTLQLAQVIQAQRDDRRASGSPSRTNQGEAPRSKERKVGTRKQRELTLDDLNAAVLRTAELRAAAVGK